MKLTEQNLDSVVTRARERAEREHNKGEVQTCGGCRWLSETAGCVAAVPMWASHWVANDASRTTQPDTDATDCEAWEERT